MINNIFYKKRKLFNKSNGFTLVELLVVVAVIGLLSSIVFTSFTTARKKARIGQRVSDIKQVQAALEFFYAVNRSYPNTAGVWRGVCPMGGSYGANDTIPGLAPLYIPVVPAYYSSFEGDEDLGCYLYRSNSVDWAFMIYGIKEMGAYHNSPPDYSSYPELVDPVRGAGTGPSGPGAWKVYNSGGAGSTW